MRTAKNKQPENVKVSIRFRPTDNVRCEQELDDEDPGLMCSKLEFIKNISKKRF